jgi:hypothetical protein
MKRSKGVFYIEGVIGSEEYASIFRKNLYGKENYDKTIIFDEIMHKIDGEIRIESLVYPGKDAKIIQENEFDNKGISKIGLVSDKIENVYFLYPPTGWYDSEVHLDEQGEMEQVIFDFKYLDSEDPDDVDDLLFFDSKYLRLFMDTSLKVKDCYKFTNLNLLCYNHQI